MLSTNNPRTNKLDELKEKEEAAFEKSVRLFKQFVAARNWCSDAETTMLLAKREMLLAKKKVEREDKRIKYESEQYHDIHQRCEEIRERRKLKCEQLNYEAMCDRQQADELLQKSECQQNLGNDLLAEIYLCKSQIHDRSHKMAEIEIVALNDEIANAKASAEKQAPSPPNSKIYHELEEIYAQTKATYEQAFTNYDQLKTARDKLEHAYDNAHVEYICIKNKRFVELTRLEVAMSQNGGHGCDCGNRNAIKTEHEKPHYDDV